MPVIRLSFQHSLARRSSAATTNKRQGGKGGVDAQQEASLRITNLSEDRRARRGIH